MFKKAFAGKRWQRLFAVSLSSKQFLIFEAPGDVPF
jgi:hypothetical protein